MKKALIIGGGFAGCAAAEQLTAQGGWDVLLVEGGSWLGGGCKTLFHGGHPYTFGPRHFVTKKTELYDYLNRFVPMRRCNEHEFLTYVVQDEAFYNYPINEEDIRKMPDFDLIEAQRKAAPGAEGATNLEEYWINSVGPRLYEKYVKDYNKKMWMVEDNTVLDTFGWSAKGPTIQSGPRAVFPDWYSAYPIAVNGYDDFFAAATKDTQVRLKTRVERYDILNKTVVIEGETMAFDLIVNTIGPDIVMENCYGALPFIGRDFYKFVLPVEQAFPENVYFLYYADAEPMTRIVEYKKLTRHQSPTTLLGMEIPSMKGRYYPMPIKKEIERAKRYMDEMPDGVFNIGRAGCYTYWVDIDDCLEQAIDMAAQLK